MLNRYVAVGLVFVGAAVFGYRHAYEAGRSEVLADWAGSQQVAEQAVRQLETTWQNRVDSARSESDAKLRAAADSASAAAANNDRLLSAARSAADRACKNTASPARAGSPSNVLADVLSRAATRARDLAAYADRERIAREECQAAWPRG